jgi:DNA-binding transcriptional MocR family regulator
MAAENERNTIIVEDAVLAAGFTQVPNAVLRLRSPVISHSAKLTYALLLSYAWQDGSCFPGQARLAEDLGTTRQAAARYLSELETAGLVKVRRRGLGLTNVYVLPRIPDVIAAQHPNVTPAIPPDGTRTARPNGTHARHYVDSDRKDATTKTSPLPPRAGARKRTRRERAEDPAKFARGRYAVCPVCGARPCTVECDAQTLPA